MAPACSCRCRLYARVKGNLIAVLAKAHRPPFFPSGIRLQTSSLLKGLQEGSFPRPLCYHSLSPPSLPPTDAMGGQQGAEMEMGSGSLGASVASGGSKSPHGLKFGKKLYFEGVGGGDPGPDATAVAPKRRKGVVQGRQPPTPPRCQVEGCRVDLTGSKTYYCRHKVCGMHSKAPKVIVAGLEQRFCQQCSRFHQLTEFDQGKRSCRRRLAGHNERRRKPPPGSLPSHFGQLPSSFHEDNGRYGGFLVNFSHPRLSEAARDVWPTVRADDRGRGASSRNQDGLYTLSSGFAANMTQSYMQGSAGGSIFAAPKIPPGSSFGVSDSSCALSLLSTQPRGATASTRNQAPTILGSNYEGSPLAQPGASAGFTRSTWSFHSSMLEIPREVDLGQASGQCDGHFSGELELACSPRKQAVHRPWPWKGI